MTPLQACEIEAALPALLSQFYASVRSDGVLAPVFARVRDWDHHLGQLEAFWSSVMLGSGRYKGRPMQIHLDLRADIAPAMWGRWLDHWAAATDAALAPEAARALQDRAGRIADTLRHALETATAPAPAPTVSVASATAPSPFTPASRLHP